MDFFQKGAEIVAVDTMQFTGGECKRTLDAKNRIVMPPNLKKGLKKDTFYVICFPNDNYLRVYNETDLDSIFNDKFYTSGGGAANLKRQRYMFSRMITCELDTQNRFTLSQKLIDLAGIDKEVVMIAAGTRIELWSPENLEAEFASMDDSSFDDFETDY